MIKYINTKKNSVFSKVSYYFKRGKILEFRSIVYINIVLFILYENKNNNNINKYFTTGNR